MIILST